MHPRLTAHDQVFGAERPLDEVLEGFLRAGVERIGLRHARLAAAGGLDAGVEAVRGSGLDVTHVFHGTLFRLDDPARWEQGAERAAVTLDTAAALGARVVYGLTGPSGALEWEDAARAFAEAAAPVAGRAREVGIPFLVEPANMLFADIGFLHTLADTVEVAGESGLGVCLDFQHCWRDRGLRETMRRAAASIGLVQLSDCIPNLRRAYRAVPGDGVLPLERLVGAVLEDGYAGLFDLELYSDEGEDPVERLGRAVVYADDLLGRLGA